MERVIAAVHDALPLRQCSDRLPGAAADSTGGHPAAARSAGPLAEIGRGDAPCEGRLPPEGFSGPVGALRAAGAARVRPLAPALVPRGRGPAQAPAQRADA